MWALGLYDAAEQSVLLSRDRLGIKPLYLHATAERLVFASEIKSIVAFLRDLGEPVRPNPASIATYVATGLVDGLDETFFEGITRLQAATNLLLRRKSQQARCYWDLPARAAARREGLEGTSRAPW